jgi:putative copper export protein/copper(I)-binding protein
VVQVDAAERRLGRVIWTGWALMGIAGALVLLLQVSIAAGTTLVQATSDPALGVMLAETRYGRLWIARMVIWLLMGVALLLARRDARLRWLALLAGMAVLLLQSLFGHGSGVEDVGAAVAADWLHLLATVVWVGGLVAFGLVLGPVRRLGNGGTAVASRLVAAFSNLVRVCVVALVITGVYATWLHVGSLAALLGTLYGWTLLIKLALFVPLLLLAAVNLLLTSRRLRAEQPVWVGRLRGLVGAEVALTLAILVAAAALTAGSPARGTQALREQVPVLPQPIPYFGMEVTPDFMAHLDISPGWVGENEFRVGLYAPDGSMIEDASLIRLRFDSRGQAVGQSELRPEPTGDGYYSISGANLSLPGTWRIRVTVARPGEFDTVMDFEPTISPPPPPQYPPLDLRISLDERALATGLSGLLLVAVGGFFAAQGRMHWRYGGLWGGFVLVLVGGALLITTTANLGAAAAQSGGLVVRDAWMLPWNTGMTGAVYLTIDNGTDADDALVSAMTDAAEVVELHRSQLDVGKMSPVEGLTIPAGGTLAISPQNYHLMLINMQRDVTVGDTVNLILHFRSGATQNVVVQVVETIPDQE